MKICFATHNENKLREINQILTDYDVVGLTEIGCHDEIPETGATLEENSKIKAEFVATKYSIPCFADDTGLEVEALDGEPGVFSARYAGEERDNLANINLLLGNLKTHTNKSARFRTVITLIIDKRIHQFEGIVTGRITEGSRGTNGFGYDPIFIPEGYESTFAEMPAQTKNSISHRGRAVARLTDFLEKRA
ncbi:MAG: non-canonical purine NTP diphosphatase [Reichenbachiella sp.]|uniref:non-canonical purine NTP diphosphatase n=1 Tax=Reichenbachiella sp. TaxID=2184521 RepID=UPI003262FF76